MRFAGSSCAEKAKFPLGWRIPGFSVATSLLLAMVATLVGSAVERPNARAWDAPELVNPTTVVLPDGPSYTRLSPDRDYLVSFPDRPKVGFTMIEGGRNVVIQNGAISLPVSFGPDSQRRGLYIKNATGVVHIEDVHIEGMHPDGFDGIAISAPLAIVQIVDVRVDGITGRADGFHGDVIQPFGGVAELRIDHLSATSNYQGLYLQRTEGQIGAIHLRNVDIQYLPNAFDSTTYLLWLPVDPENCSVQVPVLSMENVFIEARIGQTVEGFAVWPNSLMPEDCSSTLDWGNVTWPDLRRVKGGVIPGVPPEGSFVPQRHAAPSQDQVTQATPSPAPFVPIAVTPVEMGSPIGVERLLVGDRGEEA